MAYVQFALTGEKKTLCYVILVIKYRNASSTGMVFYLWT